MEIEYALGDICYSRGELTDFRPTGHDADQIGVIGIVYDATIMELAIGIVLVSADAKFAGDNHSVSDAGAQAIIIARGTEQFECAFGHVTRKVRCIVEDAEQTGV